MTTDVIIDNRTEDAKQFARILYIVHGAMLLLSAGYITLIPLIINYVKRPDTSGTFVYSHHTWMISTFWIYWIGIAISWILVFTVIGALIGFPLMVIMWIWYCYRVIKGFIDLNENRPMA
jgi:uncharacterized membrane protein